MSTKTKVSRQQAAVRRRQLLFPLLPPPDAELRQSEPRPRQDADHGVSLPDCVLTVNLDS